MIHFNTCRSEKICSKEMAAVSLLYMSRGRIYNSTLSACEGVVLRAPVLHKQAAATAVRLKELSQWLANGCGHSVILSSLPEVTGTI